jgi:hypothetical protein
VDIFAWLLGDGARKIVAWSVIVIKQVELACGCVDLYGLIGEPRHPRLSPSTGGWSWLRSLLLEVVSINTTIQLVM